MNSMPSLFLTENFKQMLPACGIFFNYIRHLEHKLLSTTSQKENIHAKTKEENVDISDPQNYIAHPQWTRAEIPKPSHTTKFTFQCMYQFIFVTAKATAYNKMPLTQFGRHTWRD